jgi:hypothetical protein
LFFLFSAFDGASAGGLLRAAEVVEGEGGLLRLGGDGFLLRLEKDRSTSRLGIELVVILELHIMFHTETQTHPEAPSQS